MVMRSILYGVLVTGPLIGLMRDHGCFNLRKSLSNRGRWNDLP
jgi:hypothetical protein